jgi:predicted CoA-binding protein
MNEASVIEAMLSARTIAVVGLSADATRPSHTVSAYMQAHGYRILPVNPGCTGLILGEQSYASLADLPVTPDVVNVFRPAEAVGGIVEEMIALGLTQLWVQLGIRNAEAATAAEAAGIAVVMDRCILIEHKLRR